jgi:synaptojanin
MTTYDKRRIVRLYGDGKSYVITSQHIDEKLQIKLVDSAVCLNKLMPDEWNALTTKTNSVRSASYSVMLEAYGCLGLMSTSLSTTTTTSNDDQSSNSNSSMQHCLLFVKEASLVGTIRKFEIMKITDVFLLPIFSDVNSNIYSQQQQQQQSFNNTNTNTNNTQINSNISYFNDLRKFLSSGVFYFVYSAEPGLSSTFDLTLSCQARTQAHLTNKKFFWNYNLHIPFRRLGIDTSQWLLKCICGCVEIKKVFTLSKSFKACLFSRLSCDRVGTRFQCRGLNDEGNCANFVETEQILFSEDSDEESSFLQVRGSVPVFFEQTGIQVGNHRIKVSRGLDTCYPAFDRHVKSLIQEYGSQFYILNLLGTKGDESALTDFFESLCISSPLSMSQQLVYSNFDYHSEMKSNKGSLGDKMWPNLIHNLYADNHKSKKTDGMFFYYNNSNKNTLQTVIKQQTKFIRTNCMDCLDRTNNVQAYIGLEMLTYQLQEFLNDSETNKAREVRELFRQMWIINGDYISKIYAGTGAIQGKSKVEDISRSLTRAIQNNFLDSNKQDAIDTFLFSMSRNYGDLADRVKILMSQNFLRLPYSILRHMVAQYRQYTEQIRCRVLIGL